MGRECHLRDKPKGKVEAYSEHDLLIPCGDRTAVFGISNGGKGKTRHPATVHGYVQASPQIIDEVSGLIEKTRAQVLNMLR